ncbi:DNA methyltransferase [Sphingomonas humi]
MTVQNSARLGVVYKSPSDLKPYDRNARTHTPAQVRAVAKSIQTYGWTNPILVDEQRGVIAGHARLAAAMLLGMPQVPTICIAHMTAAQKRAYIIADNRMNEIAGGWDRKILALEHEAIRLLDPSFDISNTGFSLDDIEIMIDGLTSCGEDEVTAPGDGEAVTRVGDLWCLGKHKVLCGNALEKSSFETLMGQERAQLVLTDPPYNVKINGNVAGRGKHREFVMASGEMTKDDFTIFLTSAFGHLIEFSADGSIHYLFMDWRHLSEMTAATAQYAEMKNLICWNKQSAGMGTFYRSQHELIWVMKKGSARHINNFGLGEKGRSRTNVWDHPGLAGWSPGRSDELGMHPTVKPVAMIGEALKDCSKKGGVVLDCFGGSGSTLIAAERTGRCARLMELDPAYVDLIVRRWEADTGGKAVLFNDGRSFAQVEREGRA